MKVKRLDGNKRTYEDLKANNNLMQILACHCRQKRKLFLGFEKWWAASETIHVFGIMKRHEWKDLID